MDKTDRIELAVLQMRVARRVFLSIGKLNDVLGVDTEFLDGERWDMLLNVLITLEVEDNDYTMGILQDYVRGLGSEPEVIRELLNA